MNDKDALRRTQQSVAAAQRQSPIVETETGRTEAEGEAGRALLPTPGQAATESSDEALRALGDVAGPALLLLVQALGRTFSPALRRLLLINGLGAVGVLLGTIFGSLILSKRVSFLAGGLFWALLGVLFVVIGFVYVMAFAFPLSRYLDRQERIIVRYLERLARAEPERIRTLTEQFQTAVATGRLPSAQAQVYEEEYNQLLQLLLLGAPRVRPPYVVRMLGLGKRFHLIRAPEFFINFVFNGLIVVTSFIAAGAYFAGNQTTALLSAAASIGITVGKFLLVWAAIPLLKLILTALFNGVLGDRIKRAARRAWGEYFDLDPGADGR